MCVFVREGEREPEVSLCVCVCGIVVNLYPLKVSLTGSSVSMAALWGREIHKVC